MTVARVGPACLRMLVRASCTMRYAFSSTVAGQRTRPAADASGRPAARPAATCASSQGSRSRRGLRRPFGLLQVRPQQGHEPAEAVERVPADGLDRPQRRRRGLRLGRRRRGGRLPPAPPSRSRRARRCRAPRGRCAPAPAQRRPACGSPARAPARRSAARPVAARARPSATP